VRWQGRGARSRDTQTVHTDKIDLLIAARHQEDRLEHYPLCLDYAKVTESMACSIMPVKTEPWKEEKRNVYGRGKAR